ncbi:MAG: hypothetical protein J0L97_07835 [Alphaproteobacteria bacterium]|nr:hypothetical protein [Alphaproteobacteria bacterium]
MTTRSPGTVPKSRRRRGVSPAAIAAKQEAGVRDTIIRARQLTVRLLDELERCERVQKPLSEALFGEKETYVSALVKLSQTLIRLVEIEQGVAKPEKDGEGARALKEEDVAIMRRYVEAGERVRQE